MSVIGYREPPVLANDRVSDRGHSMTSRRLQYGKVLALGLY